MAYVLTLPARAGPVVRGGELRLRLGDRGADTVEFGHLGLARGIDMGGEDLNISDMLSSL